MPICPYCSRSSASEAVAGVDECPSCGGARVWPRIEGQELGAISDAELHARLKRAVLRYGVMPWTVPMLLAGREDRRRIYTRSCWTIERRVATPRMLAAARSDKDKITAVPPNPAIDIWASDPESIRRQTQCVLQCPPCRGTGEVTCPKCRGSNRIECRACRGRGQLEREDQVIIRGSDLSHQTATVKRTEQCLPCRGTGQAECDACHDGKVECMLCGGSTCVEAWIEVSVERMGQVRVAADFDVEAMHPEVANSNDFATSAERLPAELIADTDWQSPDGFTQVPVALQFLLDPRRDRVRAVRVQQLCASAVLVSIATRLQREVVELAGRPPQLVSGSMRALGQRAWLGFGAGIGAIVLGLGAVGYYLERSTWFAAHGRAGTLAALLILAGVSLGGFVLGATLPSSRRSWLRWVTPLTGLLLTLGLSVQVWSSVEPDVLTARAAIERGELERAEEELEALAELGRSAGVAEVRAELDAARGQQADRERLARLHAAEGLGAAAKILRDERWYEPALHDEQIADHARRARAAIDEAWAKSDVERLDEIASALRGLDDALASDSKLLAKLLAIRAAIAPKTIGRQELEAAQNKLAAISKTDATADRRAIIETELRDAIATAARREYALGLDEARPDEERLASLASFEALVELYETITGELPSEVDREHAGAAAKQLGKAIEKARRAAERKAARQ
jgi:hypothetical protein